MFGISVAIFGPWAVVGAHRDENSGTTKGEGSATVYNLQSGTWRMSQKLLPPSSDWGQELEFGSAVAISGTTIAIGAHGRASNTGAVYVFDLSLGKFSPTKTIVAPDGAAFDEFGSSIAVDNDVLAVGAYMADTVGSNSDAGATYVFRRGQDGVWDSRHEASSPI